MLSLRAIAEWDDLGEVGVSYMTDKMGYKAIIDHLRSKIPDSKIHFNHRVANIDFSGPETILTFTDGKKIGGFDYVIVTSSIGHLKKFARKMFTPALPKRKLKAIDKIGMGTSAKIFFEFPDMSWKKEEIFTPLPISGCLGRKQLDPIEEEFNTFQSVPWAPNILMTWIAGHGPRKIDNIDDEELSKIVVNLLRDVYSNDSIPFPTKIIRNKWTHNDLFGGSYSFVTFEQAQARIKHSDMSIPVKKDGKIRIQFAGEGTHHRIFQTCVGAFLSGRREADRIVSMNP
ncbi:hypothetical protein FO519_008365 [Halicephalobus sp. NKZ332]|nr:hypothetical protein FO519_008365 [Halicephalobus sp. NKZ332]